MFEVDRERINDSDNRSVPLNRPYLGLAKCSKVAFTEKVWNGGKDDERKDMNLVFSFTLAGDEDKGGSVQKGVVHTHYENQPSTDPQYAWDAKKIKATATRIFYLLTKIFGEKKAEAIFKGVDEMDDLQKIWTHIGTRTNKVASGTKFESMPMLKIKVPGSVYNGRGRVKFTGYPGFIKGADEALDWDKRDLENNAAYNAWYQSANSNTPGDNHSYAPANTEDLGGGVEDLDDLDDL